MGCLYCGKEIGPFRILRDSEFCSSEHRKNYGKRLNKVLGKIAAPTPPPAGIAGFQVNMPILEGAKNFVQIPTDFQQDKYVLQTVDDWPVEITPVLGATATEHCIMPQAPIAACMGQAGLSLLASGPVRVRSENTLKLQPKLGPASPTGANQIVGLAFPQASAPAAAPLCLDAEWLSSARTRKMPEMVLAVDPLPEPEFEPIPNPCEQPQTAPAAEPAEREVVPAAAIERLQISMALPELHLAIAGEGYSDPIPEPCELWMAAPWAQAVERELIPMVSIGMLDGYAMRLPGMQIEAPADSASRIPEASDKVRAGAQPESAERELIASASAEHRFEIRDLRLPRIELAPVAETIEQIPDASEQFLPAAQAEAVEREWIAAAAAECRYEIRGLRLPQMSLTVPEAHAEQPPAAHRQSLPGALPEVAERFVIPADAVRPLELRAVRLPELRLAVALDLSEQIPEPGEQWMSAGKAEAAEREVVMAMAAFGSCGIRVPRLPEMLLAPAPASIEQISDYCLQQPVLPAAAAAMADAPAAAASAPRLPELQLAPAPAALRAISDYCRQQPVLPAAAAMTAPETTAVASTQLPAMDLAVAAEAAEPVERIPNPCEQHLPMPAAEAAERELVPAEAAFLAAAPVAIAPAFQFKIVTHVPSTGEWKEAEAPQAAAVVVEPRCRMMPLIPLRLPVAELQPIGDVLAKPQPREMAAAADSPLPPPVESRPGVNGFLAEDVPFQRRVLQPVITLSENVEFATAFDPGSLVGPATAQAPPIALAAGDRADGSMPTAGFAALDFYCETGARQPAKELEYAPFPVNLAKPHVTLRLAMPRPDDPVAEAPVKPFTATLRVLRIRMANNLGPVAKIAACLTLITSLWLGSRMLSQMHSAGALSANALDNHGGAVLTSDPAVNPQPKAQGALASVKRAIAERAAVELTDSFQAGMKSWGAGSDKMAKGWVHDAAGFVRPGDIALFKPTLGYKDYKLEFYGQIETKSMDWAVRAHDPQNYYAMKFKVIESGLRPVIAMVHYPVVGGQAGHRTETPLSVMVHNNEPYHVAVDVKGNRIATSIEGQEVDVWTDDSLASGGVGFFAEAGSKARLYWMKVSKNEDLLGRICAYLAGSGSAADTAEVWGPMAPQQPNQPPAPAPRDDAAAAVVALVRVSDGAERNMGANRWRV